MAASPAKILLTFWFTATRPRLYLVGATTPVGPYIRENSTSAANRIARAHNLAIPTLPP